MRDDFEFNVKFCEIIEKYPELYDFNRSDYCGNRSVQQNIAKAWQSISRELKETVDNCKDRWKNIRGRYTKYKKKKVESSGSGAKHVKEYYLAPHLLFLDKFLKPRPSKSNLIEKPTDEETNDNISADDEEDHEPLPEDSCFFSYSLSPVSAPSTIPPANAPSTTPTPPAAADCNISRKRKATTINNVNESDLRYFLDIQNSLKNKNEPKPLGFDPDMAFLQSLLPDMKAMTAQQKRKFKIGILNLSCEILEQNALDW